ncbi:FecR family protein [Sphingobacterium sp. HMA12]|uniref:FecR family protein n=1 Tax=Sphingobacterium sp. HMA12 TaxID=2050894 RepID=UPI000CEA6BF7|nr:FecR family protein [Sphingobacterium sp. HMA12]
MHLNRIDYLLERYYLQQLTEAEWPELQHLLLQDDPETLEQAFIRLMHKYDSDQETSVTLEDAQIERILAIDKVSGTEIMVDRTMQRKSALFQLRLRIVAAVACILIVCGIYWYQSQSAKPSFQQTFTADFQPGHDGGMLSMPNGKIIQLDNSSNKRLLSVSAGVSLQYDSTQAVYSLSQPGALTQNIYHTIETPNGRRYHLTLSDGTQIWLNAGSRLRFPIAFDGSLREVFLTGEAYFEVSKNPHRPFLVNIHNSDTKIEVLGTHFNVSSYPEDHGFITTLLEGKVRIFSRQAELILRPGDRAISHADGSIQLKNMAINNIDADWKDNYFSFSDDNIETVMLELARWYDIRVEYEGPKSTATFSGKIGKKLSFAQVMEIIGGTDIKYSLDTAATNRKVVIKTNY